MATTGGQDVHALVSTVDQAEAQLCLFSLSCLLGPGQPDVHPALGSRLEEVGGQTPHKPVGSISEGAGQTEALSSPQALVGRNSRLGAEPKAWPDVLQPA